MEDEDVDRITDLDAAVGSICCEAGCDDDAVMLMVSIVDRVPVWMGDAYCFLHMTMSQRLGQVQNEQARQNEEG